MSRRGRIPALLSVASLLAGPAVAGPQPPWLADPFPSAYAPPAGPDLLVQGVTVLDGAGHRLDGADVLVRSGKIAAVGRGLAAPAGARKVDGHGRWLTPGVIDIHSHDGVYVEPLTEIDRESGDVAEESSPNAADVRIENAINPQDVAFSRALEHGVTTLQILPGSDPIFSGRTVVVHPVRATTVAAMKLPDAPQGFKMACGENPKEKDAETHRGPTSRQGEVAYIRAAFLDAQDYRRDWDAYAAGRGPPPRRDLKREALAGILAGDIHVHMHCYRADDMATMLSVAHEFGFRLAAFHHAVEAYKIPALFTANGTCAVVWGGWWGYKMEALDGVRANAALLDRDGVCVTMHSDSPSEGQRLNLEAARAAGAARRVGVEIPPERMIAWITANPARALGLADRIGQVAKGYDADLVLWSANPFSVYAHADLVVIDGAVAFERAMPAPDPASDFELGRSAVRP